MAEVSPDDLLYVIGKLTVEKEFLAKRIEMLENKIRDLEAQDHDRAAAGG